MPSALMMAAMIFCVLLARISLPKLERGAARWTTWLGGRCRQNLRATFAANRCWNLSGHKCKKRLAKPFQVLRGAHLSIVELVGGKPPGAQLPNYQNDYRRSHPTTAPGTSQALQSALLGEGLFLVKRCQMVSRLQLIQVMVVVKVSLTNPIISTPSVISPSFCPQRQRRWLDLGEV